MRKLPSVLAIYAALSMPALGAGNVLMTESFDDTAFSARGWYDGSLRITTTEHISGSTASAVFHYRQGATTPDSGGAIRHKFAPSDGVYLRYWVKYSANWQGSNRSYHPHEFYLLTNKDSDWSGLSSTVLTLYVEQNEGTMRFGWQDSKNIDTSRVYQNLVGVTEYRAVAGCNGDPDGFGGGCYAWGGGYQNEKKLDAGVMSFQDTAGANYKGDWHKVEAFVKLNSISNGKSLNDGVVRIWVDGKALIDKSTVVLRTAANGDMKLNQLVIGPYIGDGSPVDQTFWIDELYLADNVPQSGAALPNPPQLLEVK